MYRRRQLEASERSETTTPEYIEVSTAAEALEKPVIFHVVKEMVGFVLFMHQQIPAILQDISLEFEAMRSECKELELVLADKDVKPASRRQHLGKMRQVKQGIKKLEKLMTSFSNLQTALRLMLNEINCVKSVILVLGSSPIRPQHVYEMVFAHERVGAESAEGYNKSKVADALSRKVIRALISKGAGSVSYSGPTKLFLLVQAPATFNMPLHFLPKRDFKYGNKIHKIQLGSAYYKVVPLRLRIKCKVRDRDMDVSRFGFPPSDTISSLDASSNDLIWFQCRHTIKGLAVRAPSTEE